MKINKLKYKKINNKKYFLANQYSSDIQKLFKEINKEMVSKYALQLPNRDFIIKSLIQSITQGDIERKQITKSSFQIIRLDIKSFFPSINKHKLYRKISYSNLLSEDTIQIIKSITFNNYYEGVPIGLPFSSSLAEIALEDFDNEIKNTVKPLFYFRFVDDIILFISPPNNKIDNINKIIEEIFDKHQFDFNEKRSLIKSGSKNWSFEYLGYSFSNVDGSLKIGIANKKLKKVKTKLHFYFRAFHKNNNFWLLYYRIKELIYSNTSYKDGEKFRYGFSHAYRFINNNEELNSIINLLVILLNQTNLSSRNKYLIFSLIPKDYNSLEKHKFNYTRISKKQLRIIANRLGIRIITNNRKDQINLITKEIYTFD
jgi:hypothetical protein